MKKSKKKYTIVLMHGDKEITRFESPKNPPARIYVKASQFVGGNSFTFIKVKRKSYVHTYQSRGYLNHTRRNEPNSKLSEQYYKDNLREN